MIKGYQTQILKIYETIRANEAAALKSRRKEIEEKLPYVIELEKKINKLCIDLSVSALKPIENREEYMANLKEKITDLRMKKSELLVSNGYAMDYLTLHYKCSKCKDTGFIGTKQCTCYKRKLIYLYYKNSTLSDILEHDNFDNFKYDYYPSVKNDNNPKSPRKNIEEIVKKSLYFIESFNSNANNLLFYGSSGTGKTFLTHCISKELLDRGHLVIYRTASDLINDLKKITIEKDTYLNNILINCDLLIIDDLGTEQISRFTKTELFNLINKKLLINKKMIVSTNYSLDELHQNYSERLASRLLGEFTLCKFYGNDIRVKINLDKMKQQNR